MTQSPIEPRHKDEAAKAAGAETWDHVEACWPPESFTHTSILAHAQTLANLEAARADLVEIDRIAANWDCVVRARDTDRVATIAAPYRASDPVAEELQAICDECGLTNTPKQFGALLAWHKQKLAERTIEWGR